MLCKSYLLSFCISICLASCGQRLYPGIYNRSGTNEKFEIKDDSTFEYSMKSGNDKSYSSGKWVAEMTKSNTLLLKSTYHKDSFPLFVNEVQDAKTNNTEIRIEKFFERAKDTSLWMVLVVNDTLSVELKSSVVKMPMGADKVRKLHLIFYYNNFLKPDLTPVEEYTKSFRTVVYEVKNNSANVFYLSYPAIDLNMFYYSDFDNDKVVIRGKKLHWLREDKIFELK